MSITWDDILLRVDKLRKDRVYYGVPRGGTIPAIMTGNYTFNINEADVILDDLHDSGRTRNRYAEQYPEKDFIVLYDKRYEYQNQWLVFPWERSADDSIEDAFVRILQYKMQEVTEQNINQLKSILL